MPIVNHCSVNCTTTPGVYGAARVFIWHGMGYAFSYPMLFLNPWMLLGLAGVSVPLLLHLLNRRKSRRRDWGAMMFLVASLAERRRRVLVEEILLMLTRCLIVALAGFAFARPFATSGGAWLVIAVAAVGAVAILGASAALWSNHAARRRLWIAGGALAVFATACVMAEWGVHFSRSRRDGAKDVAIIIDASSSMTLRNDGSRNFDAARKIASEYIEASRRNTAFTIVLGGSVSHAITPAPTTDRRLLFRLLDEAVPLQGTLDMPDALAEATTSLMQGTSGNKEILVIGDGQKTGWDIGEDGTWECAKDVLAVLPRQPRIVLRRLPAPGSLRNLTVSSMSFSRDVIGTDREVRIDVAVANNGDEAASAASLSLATEGRVLTSSGIGQLQPGESRVIQFNHRFSKPGTHEVRAYLDIDDDLPADDALVRVAAVRSALDVLVVEGARSRRMSGRAGAYIALALAPSEVTLADRESQAPAAGAAAKQNGAVAAAAPRMRTFFRPRLALAQEMSAMTNLSPYSAIILADVPRLSPDVASRLISYVERGGGLMVVNSSASSADFYNGWTDDDGAPVMPLMLLGDSPMQTTGTPLDPRTLTHPSLAAMAEKGDLAGTIFERIWKTAVQEGVTSEIGARLFDGSALLAERKAGRGRIVQFAAGLDPSSGNFISRQSFLPLAHALVGHIARPVVPGLNVQPSQGLSIVLSESPIEDSTHENGGLRGVYRSASDGGVIRISVDGPMTFGGQKNPIDKALPSDAPVTVEWSGSLMVPKTGTYNIYARAGGNATIAFADDKRHFGLRRSGLSIDLAEGRRHDFVVTYSGRNSRDSHIDLRWNGNGIGDQSIPRKYLSPVRNTQKDWSETYTASVTAPDSAAPVDATLRRTADALSLDIRHRMTPGVYTALVPSLLAPDLATLGPLSNGFARISFAVATDGGESRMDALGEDDVAYVSRFIDFAVADDKDSMQRALGGGAVGRELWRRFAVPLLALILLEVALCRWITEQRRVGEEGGVEFGEDAAVKKAAV